LILIFLYNAIEHFEGDQNVESGGYFDPVFYGILLNDYSVVEVVLDGVNLFATKFSTHFF